jgi:DNA-binding PadR family transcriptional regulator
MSREHHSHHGDSERFGGPMRGMRGGPFGGGGPMFGGHGPFGGGRGRARRGDVRRGLLMLLAEDPRNGYQLMQEIEERSGGRWRPSPGSVYPALAQLEDQGFVRATERDGAKLFEITDAGREHLDERHADAAPWDSEREPGDPQAGEMRSLIAQTAQAAWQVTQVGNERQLEQAQKLLADARRGLYRILADDAGE